MNLIHLTSQCKPVKSAFPGSIQEILRIQHKLLHSAIQKKSQQTAMSHLPYLLLNPRLHRLISAPGMIVIFPFERLTEQPS